MTDLSALIARLEAAEAGSRELDVAIARSLGWGIHNARRFGLWVVPFGEYDTCDPDDMFELGAFTASLDAALALAERVLPDLTWRVQRHSSGMFDAAFWADPDDNHIGYGRTTSPVLALVIATLRAKQGEGE